jgi:DNA-binding SARP family transcriptional activator
MTHAAKFSVPGNHDVVPRPRLFALLDGARHRAVTWLMGPPGAGKTALVASYFAHDAQALTWYRTDDGDQDLATVFHNLRAIALRRSSEAASVLPAPPRDSEPDTSYMRAFFRAWFALPGTPASWVVDDFRELRDGRLASLLDVAVKELPRDSRIIVISRHPPPPAISALELTDQLAMIGWQDLRLTLEEAEEIADAHRVTNPRAHQLHRDTDGWVSGFKWLCTQPRGTTRAPLFHYFAKELMDTIAPETQRLLLGTSLLPDFTVEQANLFAEHESRETIAWLCERQFFIETLAGDVPRYRYQSLFHAFLRERVRAEIPAADRAELLSRAAKHAERNGARDTAFKLFVDAANWEEAARVLCLLCNELLAQGRSADFDQCIDGIPDSFKAVALLIKAHALLSSGRKAQGLDTLRAGLLLGREAGSTAQVPTALVQNAARLYAFALEHDIESDYVRALVRALGLRSPSADIDRWPWPIRIYTLGRFAILLNDEPIRVSGKAQRKPLELLMALIALGGRAVSIDSLIAEVWPDDQADARANFDVTLLRLRRLLGRSDALRVDARKLTLDGDICWVDAWAFGRVVKRIEQGAASRLHDRVLDIYRGSFLNGEGESICVHNMRDQLAAKFQRAIVRTGEELERAGRFEEAARVYARGLEQDNLVEEFYQRLIHCEWSRGRRAEAIRNYQRCRKLLSINLRVLPSRETEAVYRRVLAGEKLNA